MLEPLAGVRVGILQTRYAAEFARLIERVGGIPVMAPSLREVGTDDQLSLRAALEEVAASPVDVFVFQTGVGTRALLEAAADMGLGEALAERIRGAIVVARGPKPLTALLQRGFPVERRTAPPHTTDQLLELLPSSELRGCRLALQHYGTSNQRLLSHLLEAGTHVIELAAYRWALPEEVSPVLRLLELLAAGQMGVIAFTSAAQVDNLFAIAASEGQADRLPQLLNEQTVVAAIGPTCAQALRRRGVNISIEPENPKMVPFVRAIADYFRAAPRPAPKGRCLVEG